MDACLSELDLDALARGSASAEQRQRWDRHLDACDTCRSRLADKRAKLSGTGKATGGAPATVGETADRFDADAFAPGVRLGDFQIEKPLGAGGMGVVYRVRQLSLNRQVALKVIRPGLGMTGNALKRFHREARAAAKLHHTNIVAVHAEGEDRGICYYAMELIEGQSLAEIIAGLRQSESSQNAAADATVPLEAAEPGKAESTPPTGRVSRMGLSGSGSGRDHFDTVAKLIADAADALDYAHGQGVIHRDIKPSNLMVDRDGRLKLMDFGLARVVEEPGMTVSGEFLGTPRYMSPEQIAAGRVKIDHRTDIYSLGATLYELLTLQAVFSGERREQIISQILSKEPRRPRQHDRQIPVDLETICLKAVEKDPDRRYQTAGQMADDLRRYVNRYAITAKRVGPLGRLAKFCGRHKVPVGMASGVVLAASISAALVWKYWPQPRPRLGLTAQKQITSDPGLTTQPTLSADGTLLAYASDRSGEGHLDIWVQRLDGAQPKGEPTRLTFDEADDHQPAFSPDGSRIVFRSERAGGGVYVVPTEGGEPKRIAPRGRRPRFSPPDGKWVAYWVGVRGASFPNRSGRIYVVPSTGGSPRRLQPLQPHFSAVRRPVWSPDGTHLLFLGYRISDDPTASTAADWWVASIDGGPAVKTGAFDAFGENDLSSLPAPAPGLWVPGGHRVIFSASKGEARKLFALPISPETKKVDGALQQLTSGTGRELHPWVAAGGRVVFAHVTSKIDIWTLPIDADQGKVVGELKRLTDNPAVDANPFLSADGAKMVFDSLRSGNGDVWMKDLAAGELTRLADNPRSDACAVATADGSKVAWYRNLPKGPAVCILDADHGGSEKVYEGWGRPWDWSPDGREISFIDAAHPAGVSVLNVASGKRTRILVHPDYDLYQAHFAPDGRWITFNAVKVTDLPRSRLFVAPYRGEEAIEAGQWIPITDGSGWDDKPRWSPDGNLLYFTSERDGFRCIWAQRLDPQTKHPVGEPFEVYPFHRTRLSPMNVFLWALDTSVAHDKIVINLGELTGNIWMAELTEEP